MKRKSLVVKYMNQEKISMLVASFVQNNVIYLEFGSQVLKSTVLTHDSTFPVNSCLCLRKAYKKKTVSQIVDTDG